MRLVTENEIGESEPRSRPRVDTEAAEATLSDLANKPVHLPAGAVVSSSPSTCPACGGTSVMWGCDPEQSKTQSEIHPLVWHETQWMADTFICRNCNAGWIEPDDPEPVTWVRPYWLVG